MLFTTIDFLIFFVLVVTIFAVIKNRNYKYLFLLAASYFFFYYTSNYLVSLLIFSTILDFYVGKEIFNSNSLLRKKFLLILSLAGNLGLLGFFKYADFGISQINIISNSIGIPEIPFLNLVLPIGISFYTLQTISYTVDIYRGKLIPSKSFKEFALFVAFFPQLVAGPILRASDFLPQQEKEIRAEIESLDIKISREQSQYDEYYKQYQYYEGKTLSSNDYKKAERAFDNLNSQTEKVNTMIDQQNQLIGQLNEIIIELGCKPNFQIT